MIDIKSVYLYSIDEAKRCGEIKAYSKSYQLNIACTKAIEKAIKANFDGMHLNCDTAKSVIDEYGYDRPMWVLANTLQYLKGDGRFSKSNREWAETIYIPHTKIGNHDSSYGFIVNSHSAVLDGFVSQTLKEYKSLGLYSSDYCIDDSNSQNYTGKILVLRPHILNDEYKDSKNQLILAQNGFGCSPTAIGRKVFGVYLTDGEKCRHNRLDFIGILKDEHITEWAKEKIANLNVPEESIANSLTMI